ncbi:hypothetical protein R3P38DRAFT_3045151, partial [Favolaschia claudopus]
MASISLCTLFSLLSLFLSFLLAEIPTQVSKASLFNSVNIFLDAYVERPTPTDPINACILFLLIFRRRKTHGDRNCGSSEYLVDDARNLSPALVTIPGTALARISEQ